MSCPSATMMADLSSATRRITLSSATTIDRSIVVADDKVIRLVAEDKSAIIVADGQDIGSLGAGQFVEVRKSPTPVRVVATRSFNLASRLHEGLREGHA